ncbi:MAG: cysteine hydrolase [Candidatus Tectomicrobia bacterium]|nr:cysteine hydrolase [Candidatus Tectomicrobia bacterium]
MHSSPSIPPQGTALLVIDVQNGFCHPKGGLAQAGFDISGPAAVVPQVKRLIRTCRAAGIPVIWSRQEHYPGDMTREKHRIPSHLSKGKVRVAERGTWDSEIHDDLQEETSPEDHWVIKHRMSCFFDTNLDTKLRMLGVSTLIICGLITNVCVESTVRDAYFRDYDIYVVEDCVGAYFEDLHQATLKNVEIYFGEVLSLDRLETLLENAGRLRRAAPG